MFCLNCGQQLRDGSKFCPYCGTVLTADETPAYAPAEKTTFFDPNASAAPEAVVSPVSTAVPVAPVSPVEPEKKRRGGALIAVAGIALVAVLAVVLLVSGVFSSPKATVAKAFAKSAAAYDAVAEKIGAPDLAKVYKEEKVSGSVSVQLSDLNEQMIFGSSGYDLSGLNGLGVRYALDLDIPGRKGGADVTAFWGSSDLISAQLALNNSVIAATIPELTENTFYGLDTMTLGNDLSDLGVDDETVENISLNIFDLYEAFTPDLLENEEVKKQLKDAGKTLLDAIEVEKTGKNTVDVNDSSVKCTSYHAIIPQDAMEDFVDVLEDVTSTCLDEYLDVFMDTMQDIGVMPDYVVDEIESELSYADDGLKDAADAVKDALESIGDIELDIHISDGKVMAVNYENKIEGVKVEIGVYMGGGKNYADNFSVVFNGKADGDTVKVELVSSGDHTAKDGAFTDETTLKVREDGDTIASMKSELRYEPKAKDNNFSWTMKVDDAASFSAEGQLALAKDSISIQLDDLTIKADGSKVCSLAASYAIGPCSKVAVTAVDPVMLSTLDEDDLMDIAEEIGDNAMDWAESMSDLIEDNLPSDIAEMLLWEMGYWF